ncbi:hypothetical protein [Abyssicoccus albus]|uniref:hypothetical protein n=1 Tax=Abyssicoccus albus TaxID=1817405 RepID=UPI0013733BB0|nr:hypothetical protein [Abyssicoccus albus]
MTTHWIQTASTTVTIDNADNYTIDSDFYKPVVEPTPAEPTTPSVTPTPSAEQPAVEK